MGALQTKLESCVSEVAALDVKKLNLGEEITQLRNAMAVIDAKIPVLNEEKKSVVAARKFKEAARVQADIKQLTEEKCVSRAPCAWCCWVDGWSIGTTPPPTFVSGRRCACTSPLGVVDGKRCGVCKNRRGAG